MSCIVIGLVVGTVWAVLLTLGVLMLLMDPPPQHADSPYAGDAHEGPIS